MPVWWWSLDHSIQAALIGAAATFLAALVGAGLVFWQIGRQAKSAIAQARQTEQLKLKLKLYEEIVLVTEKAVNANVQFTGLLRLIKDEFSSAIRLREVDRAARRPDVEFPVVIEADRGVGETSIAIITLVERWLIIDPRLAVFRSAIGAALYDIRQIYSIELFPIIVVALPVTVDGNKFPFTFLDSESLENIILVCEKLIDDLLTLQSYVIDFQNEMQNLLLAELFNNRVPVRQPLDPAMIAISLDRHEELEAHLSNNTAWGQTRAKSNAETKARFATVTSEPEPGAVEINSQALIGQSKPPT